MTGQMAARRRANRKWIFFILVVAMVLSATALFGYHRLKEQNARNLEEQIYLQQLIKQEQERSRELQSYSEQINTAEFAEWYAKERMGLIHKNEVIFRSE